MSAEASNLRLNAVLLAAGYGTRLYPLTRDRPKPLLQVGGRPILDYLVEQLESAPEIERMILVTNAKFLSAFEQWASARTFRTPLEILNDGSTCNDDRLGAVADMQLALEQAGPSTRAAYVLATDNLPRFDLRDIIQLSSTKKVSAVFACSADDPKRLSRAGVAVLDEGGRIVEFEEKPRRPKSNLRVPPFYVYTPEALALVETYIAEGNSLDAPGHLLAWVVQRQSVYALLRPEGTYDIGTLKSYRAVCEEFERRR